MSINVNQGLQTFLDESPTPFHATANMSQQLQAAGFQFLDESDAWKLQAGGRYYTTRNDSSIIAFVYGVEENSLIDMGIRMIGAHTDSPCLKVKPLPEITKHGYFQLGVETYGGVLQATWFDRDLSLAGRVTFKTSKNQLQSCLVDFKTSIAIIPSLAIHLDRDANSNRSINAQTQLAPVLAQCYADTKYNFRDILKTQLEQEGVEAAKVLDFDLSFYDTQKSSMVGLQQEFIASSRLDNLLSCHLGLQAIISASSQYSSLLVCNDHEEVGSRSNCGAQGPMLEEFVLRLMPDTEDRLRCLKKSMMISADNAHGVHPNFSDKHDANHGPLLNHGPFIKVNANQSYATNSETAARFRHWCEQVDVPVQSFVVRSDMACGSTIGPITAAGIGVETIDIGLPTFAMHSIRELAGAKDSQYLTRVLAYYLNNRE
jgi:aspartyl aminopeptidase